MDTDEGNNALPQVMSEEDARAIMAAGLGKAELEFVMSLTAPFYWISRESDVPQVRSGSAFFLDAGEGVFAVTANHVIEGWKSDRAKGTASALQLGADLPIDFNGMHSLVDAHDGIDIATFRISNEEIAAIGKTVLTGCQKKWPPRPPDEGKGVYFGGFPGEETRLNPRNEISFGASPCGGIASSVSECDISFLIERDHLIPVLGQGLPPEDFDFRGISGGPMLSVIDLNGIRSWALAGVIYEGPNPSTHPNESIHGLQIIRARRAHFIRPDGTLDKDRWLHAR